jgi:hypothetical protein
MITLTQVMMEPQPRPSYQLASDWMILVFLFTLIAFAYTRKNYPFRIQRLWNSTWNIRALRQAIREEPNTPRANLLFNVNHALVMGLLIYVTPQVWGSAMPQWPGFLLYLGCVALIVGVYFVKRIGINATQFLSDGDFGLSEYAYNINLINRVIGIFLFPVLAFLVYLPKNQSLSLWYVAIAIVGLMLIYRLIRGILNALQVNVPLFYIFFYICTLEILPWIVCTKMMLVAYT